MREAALDPRRGVVLVAVLWTIALLSALAMAATAGFRGFAGVVAIDRDRARAEALFGAGLEAGAALLAEHRGRPLLPIASQLALGAGTVRLRLGDELGKIDVNMAPKEVFASLLAKIGAGDAAEIAEAIILWRDGERAPKEGAPKQGAEPAPGGAAKAGGKPRAAAFTNTAQLAQIPAVGPDYARRLAPFVTVFGAETVNAATAPAFVLGALPEMTEARVARLIDARESAPGEMERLDPILGPAGRYAKGATRAVARIELEIALADGYAAAAEAVIVILPKDRRPYRVLSFRQAPAPLAYGARRFSE